MKSTLSIMASVLCLTALQTNAPAFAGTNPAAENLRNHFEELRSLPERMESYIGKFHCNSEASDLSVRYPDADFTLSQSSISGEWLNLQGTGALSHASSQEGIPTQDTYLWSPAEYADPDVGNCRVERKYAIRLDTDLNTIYMEVDSRFGDRSCRPDLETMNPSLRLDQGFEVFSYNICKRVP